MHNSGPIVELKLTADKLHSRDPSQGQVPGLSSGRARSPLGTWRPVHTLNNRAAAVVLEDGDDIAAQLVPLPRQNPRAWPLAGIDNAAEWSITEYR